MLKKHNSGHLTLLVHSKIAVFEWGKTLIERFGAQAAKNKCCLHTVYHVKDIKHCDELFKIVTLDRVLSSCSAEKREILRLLTRGVPVAQIAERVFLSQDTVKYHIKKIYKLLNIHSKKDFLEITDAYGIKF